MLGNELDNLRQVFCLKNGTIEDYYPPSVVAEVINQEFSPETPITEEELDQNWSGRDRLSGYKKIMFEHKAGDSLEYLKSALGRVGTRILKDKSESLHPEIAAILETVEGIARES